MARDFGTTRLHREWLFLFTPLTDYLVRLSFSTTKLV